MNEKLLKELLAEAEGPITQGLSASEGHRVKDSFEHLLRRTLEATYRTPSPHNDTIARGAGTSLIRDVAEVEPQKRSDYIAGELFNARVGEVSREAWSAVEKVLSGDDNQVLRTQAKSILEEVERLQNELKSRYAPGQRSGYGRMLSEALLDANYVLGNRDRVSLRLGRTLRALDNASEKER